MQTENRQLLTVNLNLPIDQAAFFDWPYIGFVGALASIEAKTHNKAKNQK